MDIAIRLSRQPDRAGLAAILCSVSTLILAGLPGAARAQNECGADAAGADTVTCAAASYPSITYNNSDGLTLNLNNPAMAVGNTGGYSVQLSGATSATGGLAVHVISADTIRGASQGVAVSGSGSGAAMITVDSGAITSTGITLGAVSNSSGKTLIILNGGQISGREPIVARSAGTGDVNVLIAGGTVTQSTTSLSGEHAVRAQIGNLASSPGSLGITITGGTITGNSVNAAVYALHQGLGPVSIRMDGGSVTGFNGLEAAGRAAAQVTITGGTISATQLGAQVQSSNGDATLTMTGGVVSVFGQAQGGLLAFLGAPNTGNTTVALSGGSVTSGTGSGIYSHNVGSGQAVIRMTGGTVAAGDDAAFAQDENGAGYDVQVTGGTLNGGAGKVAALHVASPKGGTVVIGAGATLNGPSGVAFRDGDFDNNGSDETGGAVNLTTAGVLNGGIVLGSGADVVKVTGGSIAGDIKGGGSATLEFALGGGSFTYGKAYKITGIDTLSASSGATQIDGTFSVNTLAVRGGALTLTASDQASQTTVSSGALTINGTLTSTATTLSGGALTVNGALDAGAFTFSGGALTVNGSLSSSQAVAVPGTLVVNGSFNSSVAIQGGGKLGGNGTVGAVTLQPGATIAPGNSIGLLHVNGNLSQAAGAVYQVEYDATGADRIQVSGAATLAPGAVLTPVRTSSGPLVPGTRYTVLTASGGLTGTYTLGPAASTAFLAVTDSYDANNAYLGVVQTRPLAAAALTPNQRAIAAGTPANGDPVSLALLNLPTDVAARTAFDQLAPVGYAGVSGVLASDARLVRETALVRLRACQDSSAEAVGCPEADRPAAWAQDFGSWSRTGATGEVTGTRSAANGFLIGFDSPLARDARIGAFAGYSRTRVTTDPGAATIDNFHAGVFGGVQRGALSLRADAAFSDDAVSAGRSVAFAGFSDRLSARYDAHTAQVEGEAGYRLQGPAGVALEPFVTLAYVGVHAPDFAEQGGAAAVSVRAQDTNVSYGTVGVRPSFGFKAGEADITVQALAGWRFAGGDRTPVSTQAFSGGPSFTVQGAPLPGGSGLAGVQFGMRLADRAALSVSYGGQFGGASIEQTARATLSLRF